MKRTFPFLILIASFFVFSRCEIEEPESGRREGNKLHFSDRWWTIKDYKDNTWGPGPNYFSTNPNHVWVDDRDRLHMTISQQDNRWYATEIISEDTMGYGTYRFTILGDFVNMPENVTLGLFTWDDNSFFEAGNSEVDIEMSKWGDSTQQTLNYAVQPVAFSQVFKERHSNPKVENVEVLNGLSTHEFTWTPNKISWRSYKGEVASDENLIATWEFDQDNPARVKEENGMKSKAIVIPEPGETTNTRINYWLQTWISTGPTDGKEQEVIITRFDYTSW